MPYFDHKKYEPIGEALQFQRRTSFGYASVVASLIESKDGYALKFFLGLRHNLIEHTLQGLIGQSQYFRESSHTLLVDSRYLQYSTTPTLPPLHSIGSRSDIEYVCDGFIDFMDRKGFNFLEKFKSLLTIHELYNNNIEKASVWCNHHYLMSFRGMVAALILQHADALSVYHRQRQYLISRGYAGEVLKRFDATFAHLNRLSLN